MKKWLIILLLVLPVSQSHAHATCYPRGVLQRHMKSTLGQTPTLLGFSEHSSAAMEVWLNPAMGTWSIVIVKVTGDTCLVLSGTGFSVHKGVVKRAEDYEVPL